MNNEKLHVHSILITFQYLNLYLYVSLATTITDSIVGIETTLVPPFVLNA